MDEECALRIEEGGIDFNGIKDFDAWLCEPRHLDQLLPEKKGIVGLRLRRNEKFYADASVWERLTASNANRATYILVRNGNKLWRVWNDLELPSNIFPTKAEFEELFNDRNGEVLKPGSYGYQRALDEAQGMRRHYMQVVLMLQGILDRTRCFHPLPVERVNLLSPNQDLSVVRLLRDAENLLGVQRPPYRQWLIDLNKTLDVGKRIVFGGIEYTGRSESRLSPATASWPDRLKVYTIISNYPFRFRYERTGENNWRTGQPIKKSASFKVYADDATIINFDDVQIEDIEFYLSDRCNRHEYLTSFPLLRFALQLKRAEIESEKPFVAKTAEDTVTCLRYAGVKGLVRADTWGVTNGVSVDCVYLMTEEWYMPGLETARWVVLAEKPEWAAWPKHGRREDFLSLPEFDTLSQLAQDCMKKEFEIPVAVSADDENAYAYGVARDSDWNGSKSSQPKWRVLRLPWRRCKDGSICLATGWDGRATLTGKFSSALKPQGAEAKMWDGKAVSVPVSMQHLPFTTSGNRLLWVDEAAITLASKAIKKVEHKRGVAQRINSKVWFYAEHVIKTLDQRFWDKEYAKFIDDGGIKELWEDHKKTVKVCQFDLQKTDFNACIKFLLKSKIRIEGCTTGEMWDLAAQAGWKCETDNSALNSALPGNIVFPAYSAEEED